MFIVCVYVSAICPAGICTPKKTLALNPAPATICVSDNVEVRSLDGVNVFDDAGFHIVFVT